MRSVFGVLPIRYAFSFWHVPRYDVHSVHGMPVCGAFACRLFTYPPPPATGGISVTNEDLFCLNEGEFLNDVIIDFYMK